MENKNDFLKDWLEGKVSSDELSSKKEKGDAVVQQFDELITRTKGLKVPESLSKEDAWKKLSGKLSEPQKQEAKVIKMNRWIPLSIAASVSLLVITFFAMSKTTIATTLAETKTYTLPDGSAVTLNAESEITFPRFAWLGGREVNLKGEAFFEVTKGNTFTVKSEQGTVTVLGTSFNVKSRASVYEVSCFTGKVKVASAQKEVMLTKGLAVRLDQNILTDAEPFDDSKRTWRNGDFYFDGKPLNIVLDELERQFNVNILFTGDGSRLYTGYFSNKNLNEALEMICKPMSLQYQRGDDNKIMIR